MPRNRKLFIHGDVHFITTRILKGLPLVPNEYMILMLESIIARAKELYDIKISHLLFMANHLHCIVVVDNPSDVSEFMRYIKAESAHAINKMMGNRSGDVWEDRFDSPAILDIEKLKEQIVYTYTNPQKANLVDKIEHYPGLNTWDAFVNGNTLRRTLRLSRKSHSFIPKKASLERKRRHAETLKESSRGTNSYLIEPQAAFECFDSEQSYQEFIQEIIDMVRDKEQELREQRSSAIGAKRLCSQCMYKPHTPKKFGKKMLCLGSTKEIRRAYIDFFKALRDECIQAYQRIAVGCKNTLFPPGFFLPGGLKLSEMLPI